MSPEAIQEQSEVVHQPSNALLSVAECGARDSGLLMIAIFKLAKSLLFFCVGIGALHFVHKDLGDEAMQLATALRFDPEGRFVSMLLEKVDLIDAHRMREIGFATFAYSGLALTEGLGLFFEKRWAEFLTLGLTISFLPWELYELIREATMMRTLLLLINLTVLGYLVWLLRRKKAAARSISNSPPPPIKCAKYSKQGT